MHLAFKRVARQRRKVQRRHPPRFVVQADARCGRSGPETTHKRAAA